MSTDDTAAVKHSAARLNGLAATQSFDSLMRGDSLLESTSTESSIESQSRDSPEMSEGQDPSAEGSHSTTLQTENNAESMMMDESVKNKDAGVEGGGKKKKRRKEGGGTSTSGERGGSTKKKKRRKVSKVGGGEGGGVGGEKEGVSESGLGTESGVEKEGELGIERELQEVDQNDGEGESQESEVTLESGGHDVDIPVEAGGGTDASDSTGDIVTEGVLMGESERITKVEGDLSASATITTSATGSTGDHNRIETLFILKSLLIIISILSTLLPYHHINHHHKPIRTKPPSQ